ncbi:MAG: UTP--glucose-1-phosphate uridylyltransferase [Bacteriovoracaceae bacterium]|nr:UTP--glucose-1-phosphate uridylyltransferase [Bacteriovoracaceae bacterium]
MPVSNTKKIRKAIIPIAGKGTRFLPATKVIPKEVIPIINIPMIYYVVMEAVEAGLDQIIFVTSKGKNAVADFFDRHLELETFLEKKGDKNRLELIRATAEIARIMTVTQKEQLGLGHAIAQVEELIEENERFCVLLGDDLIIGKNRPGIGQLMDISDKYDRSSVIGVMEVPIDEVHKYGVIKGTPVSGDARTHKITGMVEKPKKEEAPSRLATPGRYVLNSKIFDYLKKIPRGAGGEYQLTDAINEMAQQHPFYAHQFEGDRFDTGQPVGYLEAVVDFALKDHELREDFIKVLQKRLPLNGIHKL